MIRRLVSTGFWTDDKVVDKFTPEDKYFMLYLLTNPHTTQLGIYKLNVRYAAFETGYSEDTIKSLLDRFEKHLRIIYYSERTGEIAIKNYLIYSIIKGGKPVADLLWKEINDVKNKELVTKVFDHIKDSDQINKTVRNIISAYTTKDNSNNNINENEIHNENENENDKSYPLSCNDSSDDTCNDSSKVSADASTTHISQKKQESKHKYGEYKHVLLTDTEAKKLVSDYGKKETEDAITYLDEYIEMKGYKAKSHYLCIRKWVFDALKERDQKKKRGSRTKTNQFNNFQQREVKKTEMDDLEKQLLKGAR